MLQICCPVSSNPRYLQQRIKELERELEDKCMELFESEEARMELQARLTGNSETPTTAVATSLKQTECGGVEEVVKSLLSEGDFDGMSSAREHHMHWLVLHYNLRICLSCWRLINHCVPISLRQRVK